MKCKFCEGEISENVVKCKHCAEWLDPNHFISLINSTGGFQTIQQALTANISDAVGNKLKTILTITVPIVLFFLGGTGVLLIKAAVSDSLITMKKAEFVVNNAESAIKKALSVKQTMLELEKSKKELESELIMLDKTVLLFNQQASIIGKETLANLDSIENQTNELKKTIVQINDRLVKVEKKTGQSLHTTKINLDVSKATKEKEDLAKLKLKRRIDFVKYLIQVGKDESLNLPTGKIVPALLRADFTAIPHDFQNPPEIDEKYTSIVIGREIPNNVLISFFKILYVFKDNFTYIRLNASNSQNQKIFIGSKSEKSSERNDIKLNDVIWEKLQKNETNVIELILSLEGKVIPYSYDG